MQLAGTCRTVFTAILSSLLSWKWAPRRYFYQSLQVCGCLVPPLLVAPCLTFCRLHLCVCSRPDTRTNTGDTSMPVYTHLCKIQGHKHKQGTQVFSICRRPCPAMWETMSVGSTSCPFGIPVHFLPQPFSIITSHS